MPLFFWLPMIYLTALWSLCLDTSIQYPLGIRQ
jgi:hypothetical protein